MLQAVVGLFWIVYRGLSRAHTFEFPNSECLPSVSLQLAQRTSYYVTQVGIRLLDALCPHDSIIHVSHMTPRNKKESFTPYTSPLPYVSRRPLSYAHSL